MIKLNEIYILEALKNREYNEIEKYINNEIIKNNITDKSLKQRIRAFTNLSKKFNKNNTNRALQGAFIQGDYISLCDGFKVIQFKHDEILFPELIKAPEDVEQIEIKSLFNDSNHVENTIDIDSFILQYKKYKSLKKDDPLKKELEKFIIKSEECDIYVNIEFLKEIHDTMDLKNCIIKTSTRVSPIHFYNNDDRALLLPIRVNH